MINFYIQLRNIKTKERFFKCVKGYKLPHGLAAHKDDVDDWCITDVDSGGSVLTGLPTYSSLAPYLKDQEFMEKIFKRRETENYKKLKKCLEEYIGSLPPQKDLEPEELW